MAELRLCAGRVFHDFGLRICNRYLLPGHRHQGGRQIHAESPQAASWRAGCRGRPAGRRDVSWDCCVRVLRGGDAGVRLAGVTFGSSGPRDANGQLCGALRQSFPGHFPRGYRVDGTREEPLYRSKSAYYEILGVAANATHAQIKTAYYRQSFLFHPDRNAGSDAATVRFSEISEAYSVLGNKVLRKKYDRGLLSQADLTAASGGAARAPVGGPAAGDGARGAAGTDTRGVSDFDRFYKHHYSEQLQRDRDVRARREELQRRKQETVGQRKLGRMFEVGVSAMFLMAVVLIISLKRG